MSGQMLYSPSLPQGTAEVALNSVCKSDSPSEPQGQHGELSGCPVHMKDGHTNSQGSSCLKLEGLMEHLERDPRF